MQEWSQKSQSNPELSLVQVCERWEGILHEQQREENVHLLLNGTVSGPKGYGEGLRYFMSSFASERQVISAFRNLKLRQTGGKCGAMMTFSVDNDGVKEHTGTQWTHTGTWDQTGCNREC